MTIRLKFFSGMFLVLIFFILISAGFMARFIDRIADREAIRSLESGKIAYQQFAELQSRLLEDKATAIADIPYFKAVMNIPNVDHETVFYTARHLFEINNLDLLLLLDSNKNLLACVTDSLHSTHDSTSFSGAEAALVGKAYTEIREYQDKLYWLSFTPVVLQDQLLGVLGAGKALNVAAATELGKLTGTDVLILRQHEIITDSSRIGRSFISSSEKKALNRQLEKFSGQMETEIEPFRITLGNKETFATAIPLLGGESHILQFRALDDIASSTSVLETFLILSGIVAIISAGAVSLWLANRVSKSIRDLDAATIAFGSGRLDTRVSIQSNDEVGQLAKAFNKMASEIFNSRQAIEKERDNAQAANRAKSQFLANVSHELRTPMNSILGFSSLLKDTAKDVAQKNYVNAILTSGKGLLVLINDILDLSKIESGRLELQYTAVHLKTLFQEIKEIYQFEAAQKNLQLKLEIAPALPEYFLMAETRLRQILVNLVGNAIKFTDYGEVTVRVDGKMVPNNNDSMALIFEVEDTGIGIPERQQSNIFHAFVQQSGQDDRKYGGTGLGLAITKRLTEMMGGKIILKSQPNKGSLFCVVFDNVIIADKPEMRELDAETFLSQGINFEQNSILLVDDNHLNRRLIKEFLTNTSLIIIEAENGQDALEKMEIHTPTLVLMDLQMPVMDGFAATEKIRSSSRFSQVPVIALTARVIGDIQTAVAEAGFNAFLSKPVSQQDLLKTLARFIPNKNEVRIREQLPAENAGANDVLVYTPEGLERIQALLSELENSAMQTWQEVSELMIADDVKAFGARIKQLGETYNVNQVRNWGENVEQYADHFLVDELKKTLHEYPELIKLLKVNHSK